MGHTNINETKGSYQLSNIDHLLQEERYEEVVLGATNGLKNPESFEAILLFQRSYAYIQLGDSEKAIADLEQCINVLENPEELPQAFYNLALLYDENGDERAIEMIQKAYQLNPTEQRVKELYQTITGNKTGE
ncbi:tetratricopeptide repeat protein [Ornithinibacillus contaminans]|uniref:tetratricopeptide repeat protein n=1 Tax=Ornithinibacillus contaminans TaxID=694055 RepID=UPI00069D80BC|nr:tetratricopeptide repeat protein [Ornithinibacillus contaminans]